ncbi:MAG: hypothetical protein ACD_37C00164G0004 [uncultured bacterium]|nr:MAG: hypothetical protein ACD_37C00164G0004 [uncultured bacterium]
MRALTGVWEAHDGTAIAVNTDGIDLGTGERRLGINSSHIAGKPGRPSEDGSRVFELNHDGVGEQILPFVNGDNRVRRAVVVLEEPLFVSRSGEYGEEIRQANPRWLRGVEM